MDKTKLNDYLLDNSAGTTVMVATTTDGANTITVDNISTDPLLEIVIGSNIILKRKDAGEIYPRSAVLEASSARPYAPISITVPIGGKCIVVEEVDVNLNTLSQTIIGV